MNTMIKVTYKSRFTRLNIVLLNPSLTHVKRLFTTGHDLIVEIYDNKGNLVNKKSLKY